VESELVVRRDETGSCPGGDSLGEHMTDGLAAGASLQHRIHADCVLVAEVWAAVEQVQLRVVDHDRSL
jgi:hypothetical protein